MKLSRYKKTITRSVHGDRLQVILTKFNFASFRRSLTDLGVRRGTGGACRKLTAGISVVPLPKIVYLFRCLISTLQLHKTEARSSAGEHFLDAEGVGGSIPPVPTSPQQSAQRFNTLRCCRIRRPDER